MFDGITRKEERQVMTGTLYSPSRHDCNPVELSLQVKGSPLSKEGKEKGKENSEAAKKTPLTIRSNDSARQVPQPIHSALGGSKLL